MRQRISEFTVWMLLAGLFAPVTPDTRAAETGLLDTAWVRNGFAATRFEITGTGNRNNPLRRKLTAPFDGEELFVRYRLRYDAASIDSPDDGDGEFFVLWMDDEEGADESTHSGGVPNIGLHVADGENRFMVRYASGGEKFGPPLVGDREFLIVGRLWKSQPGAEQPFDRWDLWVDPAADAEFAPDSSVKNAKSISTVRWIGFSTGRKTEATDRIEVWDVDVAIDWRTILGLPPKSDAQENVPMRPAEQTVSFRGDVYPLLKSRCFACHAGDEPESDVRLDVADEVLNQTTPFHADESRLYQLIANGEMPPEGKPKLDDSQVAMLKTWIDEGVEWDESLLPTPVPQTSHWSFQPIRRQVVPRVKKANWVRTPIDAFIAHRQEELGLVPAPEADAATLARRIALDLTGLPPEPDDDVADVDSLLESTVYGERWARHWLDVARWGESNGYQHNRDRPYAWRYRDWVVEAFHRDLPFDQFLAAQIAGDELQPYADENIVATGFLAAARYSGNELDKAIQRNDLLVDVVNTTANAFLGLTLECAQCHSHKFDPLSQRDYYRFLACFAQGQPGNVVLAGEDDQARQLIDERWRLFDDVHARLVNIKRKQGHPEPIYVIPKSVVAGMTKEERTRFNDLEKQIEALPQSWSYYSPVTAATDRPIAPHDMRWPLPRARQSMERIRTRLLLRGDAGAPGPEVQPGWPLVFGPTPAESSRPRSKLAAWMTDPKHPLTARVWVNRLWQWHFGRGLVETSGDFGTQGTPPSHPELLDYLAGELIDSGWSTRRIQRLIVNSATYRQSSQFSTANAAVDPENRYLWRWKPRRLEAEAIRDSLLAVSGQLDRSVGGPNVAIGSPRRSLYLKQKRDRLPYQQQLFDSANGSVSCSRRRVSTTPLQPLWLLNSELSQSAAERLAKRAGSVEEAFQRALARSPSEEERMVLQQLCDERGLASACLAILNSSEFVYLP